jgi:hypothetical protein
MVVKAKHDDFAVVLQWLDSIFAAPVRQGGERVAIHALPQAVPQWETHFLPPCDAIALYGSGTNGLLCIAQKRR